MRWLEKFFDWLEWRAELRRRRRFHRRVNRILNGVDRMEKRIFG